MRFNLLVFFLLLFSGSYLRAQNVTVSGAVSGNGNYGSLSAAFTGISGGQSGATILITINASFAEVASATLGNNTWTSVTIQPSGGAWTITGSTSPLLNFNGADNVTVDGLNSGGNALTLDFSSTSPTACTIRFINDAKNNTITRCTIKGSTTGAAGNIGDGGVVSFSTTTGTSGNDNNTVSYCDIGPSGTNLPYTCIRSYATTGLGNDNITISNNTIHDFFNGTVSGNINANGIYIVTYASGWNITNNKFYQSATRTFTVGAQASYRTIRVSSGVSDVNAGNFNISNNIIGYQNSSGTGNTTIDVSSNFSTEFEAIILEAGSSGASSTISGNIITNIDFTTSRSPASTGLTNHAFFGIYVSGAATISNNIIGSASGTGSITIRSRQTTVATRPGVIGIISRGAIVQTITGNTIGGITVLKHSSATQNTMIFAGIHNENSGNSIFTSNTIGNSTANNITSDQLSGSLIGINLVETGGIISVFYNTIQNLNHTGLNTGTGTATSVLGISCSGTGGTYSLYQNTIANLSNTYSATSVAIQIAGIYLNQSGSGHTVLRNKIYGITLSNTHASAEVNGIRIFQGTMTISNNMISLGTGVTDNNLLIGVNVKGGTPTLYYNSIVIAGSYGGGTNSATYAIRFEGNLSGTNLLDNILYNIRSTTSSSNNVAIYCNSMTQVTNITTCNYNNIYCSGTGTSSGGIASTFYSTLSAWQSASSRDANSISQPVSFVNIADDLHITDDCNISGRATVNSETRDYDNETRCSFPDIGADEYNLVLWIGITSSDWSTASNWSTAAVPTSSSDVVLPSGTPFSCTISSTGGSCRSITIASSSSFSIIGNQILTVNANCTYGGFANNGSFSPGSGNEEVAFNGLGTVLGTVTFNIVSTNNGLTFGTVTTTVNKRFRIDAGGYVSANPPIYTTGSATLQYNTGGTYGRSLEWSTLSGAGYPNNVQLSNNTTLDLGNGGSATARRCGGDLTIDAGSTFSMNNGGNQMTDDLTVIGSVINNGTLTQSTLATAPYNDINVSGNWTRGATGVFNPNCRAVFFNSSTIDQTVTVTGGGTETFNYVGINKPGRTLVLGANTDMRISATSGCGLGFDYLTITNGNIDLQGRTLYLEGPTGLSPGTNVMNLRVLNGTRSILSGVAGGIVSVSSTLNCKTLLVTDGGGSGRILFGNNVEVRDASGELDFGTGNLGTINYILRINNGGAIVGNAAYYAQGSKLIFSTGTPYDILATQQSWETGTLGTTPGVPWDVEVNTAATYVRTSDNLNRCVRNNFSILNGTFELGAPGFLLCNLTVGGNWTRNNSGTAFIPNQNRVTFNSSVNAAPQLQTLTVSGGGNETFYDLEENNSLGLDLASSTNAWVSNHLYLTMGLINTGANEVYLTSNSPAAITFDASNNAADSWINGYLRRKTATGNYGFPVGTSATASAAGYELITLNFSSNVNVDNLRVSFTVDNTSSSSNEPYAVTVNGTPVTDRLNAGWWTTRPYDAALSLVGSPNCTYDVFLDERGHTNSQLNPQQYAIIKRDASYCYDACATAWTQCGTHNNVTQTETGGTAHAERSGFTCNSFSDWAIGFALIILPIELITFDVILNNGDALLTWLTAAEYNSDFFAIERSTDGIFFTQIGTLKAAGYSAQPVKYSFSDYGLHELGVNKVYYRLRMVDLDQSFKYSEVREVDLNGDMEHDILVVYPNPFLDNVNILWNAFADASATIQLVDVAGRIMIEKQIEISQGANVISLPELTSFSSGVYFLNIFSGREVLFQKLVKEQ